ncbi:hypothetical protein HaLaN_26572 [Haematococcus lacustris]|uniref:Uncharacterized protein n=1 Tax=Haematococcus lacustris TaxID=44745 RepID=A0A6A0A6K6_HAELA|nr:hypothetical protein HaLaN_26572 [Haematococcus lacustris]
MVDEFRTSRVSSAYNNSSEALPGQPQEAFRWLRLQLQQDNPRKQDTKPLAKGMCVSKSYRVTKSSC